MPSTPPSTPGTGVPTPAQEPVTAVCAATYYADRRDAYAYVFRVPSTATRFTIYAADGYRYSIGETYLLSLTPTSGTSPAPLASAPDPDGTGGDPAASQP